MNLAIRSYRPWLTALCLLATLLAGRRAAAADCFAAPAGLVGWWPGDGNATDIAGGNNGTLQGGATANGSGLVGPAFALDGTSGYVQIPDSPVLRPTNLTIEAWVRFNSLDSAVSGAPAGQQYIVFKQNTRTADFEGYDLGKLRISGQDLFIFRVGSSSAVVGAVLSTTLVTTGPWYHVAGVRGTNFLQLYVNGQLQGQTNVNFAQDYGNSPLYFGTSGQAYWDGKLNGQLDEVSLYNRALSSNEVAAIYAAGAAGKCKAPVIMSQPESQTVVISSNAMFTTTATGFGALSYQWRLNGTSIAGATGANLTLANVQPAHAGSYTVVVTNSLGSVTSSVATLTVVCPSVTVSPATLSGAVVGNVYNQSLTAGGGFGPYTFAVTAGTLPAGLNLSSVGLLNGMPLAAGTNSFTVMATDANGCSGTRDFTLAVTGAAPAIALQPQSRANVPGTVATFSVLATGTGPLGYQWQYGGVNLANSGRITGATTDVLQIAGVQAGDAGVYGVIVSNAVGVVTSAVATLTVVLPGACVPAVAGLVGWWPGDGDANDLASGNNGTLQGGMTASGSGIVGSAFTLDGTSGYVQIPDSPVLRPTNLTVEAWVLFSSLDSTGSGGTPAGQQYIVFKQNTRTSYFEGYSLIKVRITGGDVFAFSVSSALGQLVDVRSTSLIATGVWYHIAGVRGSDFAQLYVNGNLENQAYVGFAQDYGNLPLYFGTSGQTSWDRKLNGQLDEVSLYNRALSSNEIAAIYVATTAGKCKAPNITFQPQSQAVTAGSSAVFTVAATGFGALSYQWQFNGASIAGATGASLTLANVQPANAGSYTVVVTNSLGSVTSTVATLTVWVPPVIAAQPQSRTNGVGTVATFSVLATGTGPLGYQWQYGGVNLANNGRITGATTDVLQIADVQTGDAGAYRVVVSNAGGVATSTAASLTVTAAQTTPVITGQPTSLMVSPGANVSFGVTASGAAPLSYQWRFNGTNLANGGSFSGATSPTLAIHSVLPAHSGAYSVVVANDAGAVTSAVATLTVSVPTECLPAPAGLVGWWPGDGNANDIVGGNNGALQDGATADAPAVVGTGFSLDGTNMYVEIPDAPALRPAELTVECWVKWNDLSTPGTSVYPGQQYIVFKQNSRMTDFEGYVLSKDRTWDDIILWEVTSASGQLVRIDSTSPVTTNVWYHLAGVRGSNYIQIYFNGRLEAQTNVNFPQDYGDWPLYFGTSGQSYYDRKLNGVIDEVALYNRALSGGEIAALYASGAAGKCKGTNDILITAQPQSQVAAPGSNVAFTVTATGVAPMTYQWQFNGSPITGATDATLALPAVQIGNAGTYRVLISNPTGTKASADAILMVTGAPPFLVNPRTTPEGAFAFTLIGTPGHAYVIEITTNLYQWTPLALVTNLTGQFDFTDTASPASASRSYRARPAD